MAIIQEIYGNEWYQGLSPAVRDWLDRGQYEQDTSPFPGKLCKHWQKAGNICGLTRMKCNIENKTCRWNGESYYDY